MVAKPKNEAEAEEMRAKLAEFDRDRAREEHEARLAALEPLTFLVESEGFREVVDTLGRLGEQSAVTEDPALEVHRRAALPILVRLRDAARAAIAPPPLLMEAPAPPADAE